ncbi:VCBS repeat-containing protein [Patescibacteria group bacterium]|nr:VCBS repeat-containing protein [Patescibacteria group bacterium]
MCAKNIYGVIDYKEISVKDKEVFEDGQYITGFGSAIAHIGDVDKDGINDLAVAIEGSLEGYGIYILLMNEDGSIKSYKSILSDQYAYEQKEKVVDVAALGDFDGDQTPDIAIVSDTSGVTNPINTHILYLNTDGTLKSSQRLQDKSSADSELVLKESSITNMGDMDGDGITDIAIGGHAIKNSKDIPTVSVLFMNQDGSIKKYRQTSDSKTEFTPDRGFYGRSIDAIGDIDGDGITDLAVGSQDSVWIQFLNSDGSVKSSQKIDSKTKNLGFSTHRTMFGADVSNIGDINGDGINDLLVGNYSNDQEDRIVGKAHILLLNVDGTVKSSSTISDTNDGGIGVEFRKGIDFGWSVSHIGDFDKDGNLNILVSAPHNGYDGWVNQYGSVYNINFGCYPSTDASEVTQSKGRFSSFWASLFEFFFTNTK